jgi:glycosyltransferase involved in cell wall biosynthesis
VADKTTDETTSHLTKAASCQVIGYSHSTKQASNACQVAGYKLSVIIITKNEAENIRACLESVEWADEIIVVDSGSSDATVEICREMGAQVHEHDWPGFGIQKNRALSYATNEWVFSIDADERVTPDLKAQLIKAMEDGSKDGFFVPRLSQFCGRFIRHSGWYPDYVLRLFKGTRGRFSDDMVHERVILEGVAGRLTSPLLHYSYLNETDVRRKTEQYAKAGALQMLRKGKTATIADAPMRAGWAFVRAYFLRLGFLDGIAGFNVAMMNARTTYLKYQQLRMLCSTETTL